MEDLEKLVRRIAREEITRALGAVGAVGDSVWQDAPEGSAKEASADVLRRAMQRVARDVLADAHPALSTEHAPNETCTVCRHTKHTGGQCGNGLCTCVTFPSTEPVHTITTVPERSRATCTCHRHTHVMGYDDRCGSPFCYCLSPVRARDEHTDVHASTEAPRTCPTCSHGVHEPGKCSMHVYRRGTPIHCPCVEWVRPEAVVRTGARVVCTVCEHAPHGAGNCGAVEWPATAPCECGAQPSTSACSYCNHDHGGPLEDCPARVGKQQCSCPYVGGRAEPVACLVCAHTRHVGVCTAIRNGGACGCGGRA